MRKVMIFLSIMVLSILLIPVAIAEKHTMYLDPGESGFYDFVELEKETKITYEWEIYQHGDDYVRFWIEGSDGTDYVESYGKYSGSGTWTVPETGHYKMFWKNENMFGTVQIDYEVSMKKPSSKTPGFEFAETLIVIGVIGLIFSIKKRRI